MTDNLVMDGIRFWALIDEVHTESRFDMEKKEVVLTGRLRGLSVEQLRAYSLLWDATMDRAYDSHLWAAAYIIHGGCGDDGFSDFRSTVIMLGRESFEAALSDPETLLDAANATERQLTYENFGYPIHTVWKEKTGEESRPRASAISELTGEGWDEDDLAKLMPTLWAAFG